MNGLAERHLQRVGRDNPVEGQRTGKTVVQIARGGLFLRVGSEHAPDKSECQKNLFILDNFLIVDKNGFFSGVRKYVVCTLIEGAGAAGRCNRP